MIKTSLYKGDSAVMLSRIASESIDLIPTSPPYDNLRSYGGVGEGWNFETFTSVAAQLARVLKQGGVLVWNVSDQCVNGSYTCTSMRQVLYFTDVLGLRLHDVMVWQKPNAMPRKRGKRYQASFELMYVFSKGEPKTFNPIMRECKCSGRAYKSTFKSNVHEGRAEYKEGVIPSETVDSNVWSIPTASAFETNYTLKDGRNIHHTAVFPKELALRHIRTWTKEGDTVLDPFMGSGTSGLAALELCRSFIGCELNDDYYQMASERIAELKEELGIAIDTKPSKTLVRKERGRKYPTAKSDRAENDYYATDPTAAMLLLNKEKFDKDVWECASGENHLANVFKKYGYNVRTSDIVRRTPSTEVLDFLSSCKKWHGDIITNPPYKCCLEFVKKALSLVSEGHKVAMFLRLQFLESMERWEFFKENPPKIVYVSSKRIKCGKDGDFNSASSSITAYAWFVWEKGFKGNPTLSWINHGEQVSDCSNVFVSAVEEEVNKVSQEDILTSNQIVKVAVGQRHMNLYVQRVERSVYEKLGIAQLHYMKEPINKGAMCLLFTDLKGRNVAFVGLLNNPSRSYPNAVIVSRIVVFPQFQGKGLSVPILDKVGAMLAAKGQQLLINTENERFGKRLDSSVCWIGTTFDKKERKYYGDDATHRYRKSGYMWRKRFVGKALYGYSELFEKVAFLRERKVESPIIDRCGCSSIRHTIPSVGYADAVPSLGSDALLIASHGDCTVMSDMKINLINYGRIDILKNEYLNIAEYGYFDTS